MTALLDNHDVVIHSVVLGELAAGNLRHRAQTLSDLANLLEAVEPPARHVLGFVERHGFYGRGLSWGDLQLLAAADLNELPLWTSDKRLHEAAASLGRDWKQR